MNTPYVKQYDEQGLLINPIVGSYPNQSQSRKERRQQKNGVRFMGNNKGHNLIVGKSFRYRKMIQKVSGKRIEHYVLIK